MIDTQLLRAIKDEQKVMQKEHELQLEKDFIIDNWQFFAENKGTVKGALFQHPDNGTEMLQTLGLQNVTIHKVKKEILVKSLLRMENSDIFKLFMEDVKIFRELTAFFITGKNGLVMSNNQILKVPGKFSHKLESSGDLPDIYYMWASDLKGKVILY